LFVNFSSQAILLTPISPRSLSFRPILLPKDSVVTLQWNPEKKSHDKVRLKRIILYSGLFNAWIGQVWSARALFDGDRYQHSFARDSQISVRCGISLLLFLF
jgi:NAD kinase